MSVVHPCEVAIILSEIDLFSISSVGTTSLELIGWSTIVDDWRTRGLGLANPRDPYIEVAISERSEPVARQIDRAAVVEILKKANLDEFLKAIGLWN